MKYISVLIVIFLALVAGYFFTQPTLVDTGIEAASLLNSQSKTTPQTHTLQHSHDGHEHADDSSNAAAQQDPVPESKTGNPHFDQLTPEMQQAVKDSLLLEGPMETHTRPDGITVLPANGRFTQMPVAVEMPDGTIEIREYSVIPKTRPPATK